MEVALFDAGEREARARVGKSNYPEEEGAQLGARPLLPCFCFHDLSKKGTGF